MAARDDAYAALFARMKASVTGMAHYGRRYYDFDAVPKQPALLVVADSQTAEERPELPPKWTLDAQVILYMKDGTTGMDTIESALHTSIDQVCAALRRANGEQAATHTTLGGKVLRAQLGGPIRVYQGIPGDQAVAVVPVSMLVANL